VTLRQQLVPSLFFFHMLLNKPHRRLFTRGMESVNRLARETSPYLLQHARNPVDWYPWSVEALDRARTEDKPILVSIGYSACHWCHVMERESFEDPETAAIMNRDFINIKIDREERPDLDQVYMDAVQAMTGSGGWPLNVFLTPDGRPFYGGTYFPPKRAFNRPSWQETLQSVSQAFRDKRHEIDSQAGNLTEHLVRANRFGQELNGVEAALTIEGLDTATDELLKQADREWGGFGRAPKFPQTGSIQFLLRYSHIRSSTDPVRARAALDHALLSLDKMIQGGIYDQVGGGFARYATDTEWLIPHFEKMLYDNALLVSVLCDAYALTGKPRYREVVEQTLEFVLRECLHPEGGFYSALDADSEGVEGRYYVWSRKEVAGILGPDTDLFCRYFDITDEGNWDEGNILNVPKPADAFCKAEGIDTEAFGRIIATGLKTMLEHRSTRERPSTDDKVILGWNALMNTAFSKAYSVTGNEAYRSVAMRNMEFLLTHLRAGDTDGFRHTWKENRARFPAFLDDLSFLTDALIHLQEVTADLRWLDEAGSVLRGVLARFADTESPFFFYTPLEQDDIIVRKKEVYDGALPSANGVMACNLRRLGILLNEPEWSLRSDRMLAVLSRAVLRYPTSFGYWACLLAEQVTGTCEIAITGPEHREGLETILRCYIPNRVIMAAPEPREEYPLLSGKKGPESGCAFWLCRTYSCQRPVFSASELISLISNVKNIQ
jgi:uncharacterized protein YyaL (SSP411 family)